jgi:pyridoxamine 5'-phosphate oxidase
MNQKNGKNSLGLDLCWEDLNSKKGSDLKINQQASMCFHWKSLRRQVRVIGKVEQVTEKEADDYFNSRPYKNRVSAWASSQSEKLESRDVFLSKIKEFEKKYPDQNKVPRPAHWSGWRILPQEIEFWLDGEGRIHERLNYINTSGGWKKEILYP